MINESKFIEINGFSIAYVLDNGKAWLNADHVAFYAGYKSGANGQVAAVRQDSGIGLIIGSKHKFYSCYGKDIKSYSKHQISEFAARAGKKKEIVARKMSDLREMIDSIERVAKEDWPPRISEQDPEKKPVKAAVKHKIKSAEYASNGKVVLTFDNGEVKTRKYELKKATKKTKCSMTGVNIAEGADYAFFFIRIKGYSTYSVKLSKIKGCEVDIDKINSVPFAVEVKTSVDLPNIKQYQKKTLWQKIKSLF